MQAFMMGEANRRNRMRVFDWHTAARIIRDEKPSRVSAGLSGDWEYTGGDIYRDGAPVPDKDTYTYLSSTWATPEIEVDGDLRDCWIWRDESPGWDAETYWPQGALDILNGSEPMALTDGIEDAEIVSED